MDVQGLQLPKVFKEIARKTSADNHDDINAAVRAWVEEVMALPDFQDATMAVWSRIGRELIHDVRHRDNNAIKRAAGEFGGPAKVTTGQVVSDVAMSVYLFNIAGRTLGNILGSELADIEDAELQKANGSLFNVSLVRALRPLVKEDKAVCDCVPEKKLRKIMDRIKSQGAYKVDAKAVVLMKPSPAVPLAATNGQRVHSRAHVAGRNTKPADTALAGD